MKEIDWENYIVFNPTYLEKGLSLYSRQHKVEGGVIDLIFKDAQDKYLIVELQIGKLDPSHFSRSVYYRSLFCSENNLSINDVRVAVASHTINNPIKILCQSLNIEIFTLKNTLEIENQVKSMSHNKVVKQKKINNSENITDFYGESFFPLNKILQPKDIELFVEFYQYLMDHKKVQAKTKEEILSMDHGVPNCWLMVDPSRSYTDDNFKITYTEFPSEIDERRDYHREGVYRDLSPVMIFKTLREIKFSVGLSQTSDISSYVELKKVFTNKYLPEHFIISYLKLNQKVYKKPDPNSIIFKSKFEQDVIKNVCTTEFKHLSYSTLSSIFRSGMRVMTQAGRDMFNHLPDSYTRTTYW